ncbi:tRNA pseudouridine(13) synthase TruD [Desulfurobacterium atlanticum]|uniref:tRNA pseudouridine13 synthase n=1 Tax=Desulfurobacterium atlanticum TaxID=240169 RepID=A0A238ZT75_9BACT|nr:tRNA pseudouridine(13) synthase TruD [Desulfurobacterium atlanticum]SNR85873.1 tRNA pseudouridine13 synthase [Desulfurobacterium atlanticum]
MAKIKFSPEDFKVKEILNDNFFKNRGDYRIYRLWKRGLETQEVMERIAKISKIPVKFIGYGGLKDKNAETVQFISIPAKYSLKELNKGNLKLSFCGFSTSPITSSSIKRNRFEIVVRETLKDKEKIEIIRRAGVPNYYGEQRFISLRKGQLFIHHLISRNYKQAIEYLFTPAGWENSKSRKGKKAFLEGNFKEAVLLLSGWRKKIAQYLLKIPAASPETLFKLIPRKEIEFQINIFQSLLFNKAVASMIKKSGKELFAFKYKAGIMFFPVEKPGIPEKIEMFYPEIKNPIYAPILRKEGIKVDSMKRFSGYFHRFSRKTFVRVENFEITEMKEKTVLKFELPSGSYATNVVRFLFNSIKFKGV